MTQFEFIVAIDGPAGSGKSTIAKLIAKDLKFIYIDTGAMYRMVTLFLMNKAVDLSDNKIVISELKNINIRFEENKFFLNDTDVTERIRDRDVSSNVSKVAAIKEVREKLVELQRKASIGKKVILDGRDIGTVVFPRANLKIYLDASDEERAKRRLKDYENSGNSATYEEVLKEIIFRDKQDEERENSPLIKAEDAVLIDSTIYKIEEVKTLIIEMIEKIMIEKSLKY